MTPILCCALMIRTNTTDIPQRRASESISSQSGWQWGHRRDIKFPLSNKLAQSPIRSSNIVDAICHILRPKTSALAALIKKGSCAPPAPKAFIAFHKPGAVNPTPPITQALKSVPRYHTRFSIGVSDDSEIEAWSAIMACGLSLKYSKHLESSHENKNLQP